MATSRQSIPVMPAMRLPIAQRSGISGQTGGGYDDLNAWRNLTGGIDLAHGGDRAVVIAEFEPRSNSGRTLCIGSGCYDWYGKGVDASADYYHYNVEQMTLNAINYLCK